MDNKNSAVTVQPLKVISTFMLELEYTELLFTSMHLGPVCVVIKAVCVVSEDFYVSQQIKPKQIISAISHHDIGSQKLGGGTD